MALGLNSSAIVTLTSGTATVTVPSGVTAAFVTASYGCATATSGFTGVTLNSSSPDLTLDLNTGEIVTSAWPIGGYVWWNPTSGSQTLAMTANDAFTAELVFIAYIDDSDTTARASGIDHEFTAAASVSLTSIVSGDLIIGYTGMYADQTDQWPDLQSTFTSEQTVDLGQVGARMVSKTATGTSQNVDNNGTAAPESLDNLHVVAVAFAPAPAAGDQPLVLYTSPGLSVTNP